MSTRLVLLCASATASARSGGFTDPDAPLDAGGRAKGAALRLDGLAPRRCWSSPARSAMETAALLGLNATAVPALRDIGHGDWTGRALETIDPAALMAWLAAPEDGTPGGEPVAALTLRVGAWLDTVRAADAPVLAVTHAAVIRAALAHALGIPSAATLAIDVAPLSRTLLSFNDRWRLQELRRG